MQHLLGLAYPDLQVSGVVGDICPITLLRMGLPSVRVLEDPLDRLRMTTVSSDFRKTDLNNLGFSQLDDGLFDSID